MGKASLIAALKACPTSAVNTHPRDDNKWRENEALARACDPKILNAILTELGAAKQALKDARSYVGMAYECAFPNKEENNRVLAAIDAALVDLETQPNPVFDERAKFEGWFRSKRHNRLDRNMPDGSYNDPHAHQMWEAWQARAALQAPAP